MILYMFESTHDALAAESILINADYSLRIIPTPRQFSESCGISLLVETEDYQDPMNRLAAEGICDVQICAVETEGRKNSYHLMVNERLTKGEK